MFSPYDALQTVVLDEARHAGRPGAVLVSGAVKPLACGKLNCFAASHEAGTAFAAFRRRAPALPEFPCGFPRGTHTAPLIPSRADGPRRQPCARHSCARPKGLSTPGKGFGQTVLPGSERKGRGTAAEPDCPARTYKSTRMARGHSGAAGSIMSRQEATFFAILDRKCRRRGQAFSFAAVQKFICLICYL